MFREEADSPEALPAIAEKLLTAFSGRRVFLLYGEMGAGKTTFVRAVCRVLGAGEASSPTFSLVNEYSLPGGGRIFHLDLYRLKSLAEALDIGIEEYLAGDATLFIEWPGLIENLVENAVRVEIVASDKKRVITAR
ncbi:MAG: tRNA (adenosine(37)-N6)-threonylcarbamoyltransferase complex ATPase subunit type 1 TsaE [Flavobacteriales bacterium]|nr:tRNA (adenosine(37)-N6)-threonylcarbamoyltransferase complex ATPase subunit type 1 TsaE [Flavobacteriales bacterium]